MKTTRSATSRAKRTSWVTTIIVMPACASPRSTVSTSPTWLVEEHEPGRDGEGAGDRNALLLSAGEPVRQMGSMLRKPDRGEQAQR